MANSANQTRLELYRNSVTNFDHFLSEANQLDYVRRVDRTLNTAINRLEPVFKRMFNRQLSELLKRLRRFETLLTESDDNERANNLWIGIWNSVVEITSEEPTDSLQAIGNAIFQEGAKSLLEFLGNPSPISFTIINRRAIAYRRSDKAIKGINETTQSIITNLIDRAIENGTSYTQFAKELREQFNDFSRDRAKRIATFEIRDRHGGGQDVAANELTKKGFVVEKRWFSRGDNRVRPEHKDYDAQGYIAEDEEFKSDTGKTAKRPPTDPGCRCVVVRRVRVPTKEN